MLLGLGLGVWSACALVTVLSARADLRAAMRAVDEARRQSSTADLADGRPLPSLRQARDRFRSATDRMGSPLLLPARPLPVIGRQLRSVRDLSAAAATITGVGADALVEARTILTVDDLPPAERTTVAMRLGQLAAGTDRRLVGVRLGPDRGLVAPLASARGQLAGQLADLRSGLRNGGAAASTVADLLAGPRRYLVFAANNAEMRAGSGMLLSVGEMESGGGRIQLSEFQSVTTIQVPPGVPLPSDLADRWGWLHPGEEWTSLMLSPRFDEVAPVAAQMWVASGHRAVDGVLVVDPVTLSAFLGATGPVTVADRTISADNVVDELLRGQYFRFSNDEKVERRDDLGRIARAAFDAFDRGGWSPSRLAGGLVSAARGRHLLAWSARPAENAGWVAAGVDGGLRPESLMVALVNRAGIKIDPFLDVAARLELRPDGRDTEATLTLDIANVIPADQPSYISGPHPGSGVGKDEYLGLVSLSLPGIAEEGRFDGVPDLAVAGADGPTRVIAFQVSLAAGAQRSVVAHFRLPGEHGRIRVEPSARVPAVRWSQGDASWQDNRPRQISW